MVSSLVCVVERKWEVEQRQEVGLYVERELVAQQQRLHKHRHLRLHRELPVTPKTVTPKVSMGHRKRNNV
jgi:hypothetical protein